MDNKARACQSRYYHQGKAKHCREKSAKKEQMEKYSMTKRKEKENMITKDNWTRNEDDPTLLTVARHKEMIERTLQQGHNSKIGQHTHDSRTSFCLLNILYSYCVLSL
jgi:hypothetical protein